MNGERANALVTRIEPARTWDDIVLDDEQSQRLEEVIALGRQRSDMLGGWAHLSRGTGIRVLFAGPSGTGKTMAAEVVAHCLGVTLHRFDLPCALSKYVGESEKRIGQVFDEAERANAVLLIDECDSVFEARTEAESPEDRFANIEANYLLQRLETYRGLAVLATNRKGNLDRGFARRLTIVVDFKCPDVELRERIWRRLMRDLPLARDVDLRLLAERFDLVGGHIKSALHGAALVAADAGEDVGMRHILSAAAREQRKLGVVAETDAVPEGEDRSA